MPVVEQPVASDAWSLLPAAIVIYYAALLGTHLIFLDDLWIVLNDARWTIQHAAPPWVDHFSWSASGNRWFNLSVESPSGFHQSKDEYRCGKIRKSAIKKTILRLVGS